MHKGDILNIYRLDNTYLVGLSTFLAILQVGNRRDGGTFEQIKFPAFSWEYMSLLLHFENGTPAQQLAYNFCTF